MSSEQAEEAKPCMQPGCGAVGSELFDGDRGSTYRTCREHWMPTMVGLLEFGITRSFTNFRSVSSAVSGSPGSR